MALLRQIKASPFLSAIDGLPPALQQRLGYSRKRTLVDHYNGPLHAYYLHDMAFTRWYYAKVTELRKTKKYPPPEPLAPGFVRTANGMSLVGYVDKLPIAENGVWAVVKGVGGFDIIHKPGGLAILLGERKDRAIKIMNIVASMAPNVSPRAKLGEGFKPARDLLDFYTGYKEAIVEDLQDEYLNLAAAAHSSGRLYHVVTEAVNPKTGASLGRGQTLLTSSPVTHAEAMTIISKHTQHPGRRLMVVEAGQEDATPITQRTNGAAICPPDAIVMYHGAQRWEGAPTIVEHRKGHAENGPGIYLTTSMDTAKKYAKGGGSVYRIYLDPATAFAQDVTVDVNEAREFVQSLPRLRGKADILALLTRSEERRGRMLPIEYVVNSFVNNDAASGQHGPALAAWVTAHGADALLAPQSAKEDWIVVFNPDVICKVEKLGPRDDVVYDLPKVRR